MPELPEVETIKNDLSKKILNKKIVSAQVRKARIVKSGVKGFIATLTGNKIIKLNRRGKLLIVSLQKGGFLLVHLKMTGQLIYQKGKKIIGGGHDLPSLQQGGQGELADDESPGKPNEIDISRGKHTHIIFKFSDGSSLFFNDLRQFGYMKIVDAKELERALAAFGPEPLSPEFTLKELRKILKNKKTSIKQLLMNQKFIAGIGNIYADEACFLAKIKPVRKAASLTESEIKSLYNGIKKILKLAIKKRGTTFNNYRDADGHKGNFVKYLKVYGREGEKCKRCRHGIIQKVRLGGRGTHFCPKCQS